MRKYSLQKRMNMTFILVFTGILVITTITMSIIFERVYRNKSYQLCEQLVSLNLNLLNNQIIKIQNTEGYIAKNTTVKEAVDYYDNRKDRDYGSQLKYQRDLNDVFYVLAEGSMVSNAYIVDKQGNYIYFYRDSLKVNFNMLQEEWYRSLTENIKMNSCYVSALHDRNYLVNNSNKDCISIIMPINSGQDYAFSADAFLVYDIDLESVLNNGNSKEDMQFALLDANNELYTSNDLSVSDKERETIITSVISNEERIQLLNQKSIVVSIKSKFFGWYLIGFKDLKEIKALNITLFLFSSGIVLFAVLIIVLLSNRIARGILTPMNRLIASCNKVAAGDYAVVFEQEENEEVSFLSDTIDTMIKNIVKLTNQVVEEEKELSEEKLRVLQHQINPHFLNNVLQTIKALSIANETDKISRMTTLLGRILTYSVYQPHQSVEIKVELEHLDNYIELQNIRYDNRIIYSIDCDEKAANNLIPKLTLQPLVENSIEHGFDSDNKLMINISVENEADMVCVIINDNGQGISDEKMNNLQERLRTGELYNQECSIGIVNVNERLKKMYGEGFGVQIITKQHKGTVVVIRIPKSKEETRI